VAPGGKFTDFGLTCTEKGCDVTGKIFARQFEEGYRVQNLYLTGGAAGGTWGVNVGGQIASGLAPGITADNLQLALEALSNVAPGDIEVIGPDGGPFTLEFLLTGASGGPVAVSSVDLRGLSDADLATMQALLGKASEPK
jgi:hypothetical protein